MVPVESRLMAKDRYRPFEHRDWRAENGMFEIGDRVVIPKLVWVDFRPWAPGITGTVVRNSKAYLGIIVRLDSPRKEIDPLSGDAMEITEYNFNGRHLAKLEA